MIGWQEVILILAILLLVFGPTKLPEMARQLGKAYQEFNKASSGIVETLTASPSPSATTKTKKNEDDKLLLEAAGRLNLSTAGKTNSQLTEEILTKILNRENVPTKQMEAT